jgi:hypothetical protein
MDTVAQSSPLLQALRYSAHVAMARYPDAHDTSRIARGLALAEHGHVTLHADQTATVRSQSGHGTYRTNGTCTCPDYASAEGGRCKHRFAVSLLRHATRLLARARYAVYIGAQEGSPCDIRGMAFPRGDAMAIVFVPDDQATSWECTPAEVVLLCKVTALDPVTA